MPAARTVVSSRLRDPAPPPLVCEANLAAAHLESCADARHPPRIHARLLRRCLLILPFHWNALTRAYLRVGSPRAALRVAARMIAHGADPDRYTFPLALKAAVQAAAPGSSLRLQLHAAATKRGLARHPFTESGLVSSYAKAGDLRAARRVFDENPHRGLGSWNAVISGLSQAGESMEALALFHELRRGGMVPDDLTMVSVASACCALGDVGLAKQLHKCMLQCLRSGRLDVTLSNALVDMYAKCGRRDLAERVFERMPFRDVSSWTTMITGLATHGDEQGALDMFDDMQRETVQPNRVTMLAVLSACAHGGLVDRGMGLLKQMEDGEIKVVPTVEHYACVVDMLGRVGRVDEAHALVEQRMPMEANVVIWGTLLGACEKHGNVSVGKWAAGRLVEAEPWNDGVYVVLSNIYAAAGMWGEVERVRKIMSERKVMKSPGCSL
ncbi:pentatricopeptide repeat-containing protein At1g77170, mitochondrial-like [Phragmites australis]|uniref:pentatricopeptide repeat-containing protein At1g77170, mitochondrial-like n=1 Tax=Phragmites australis TaxID=29695 RepID=UPI002D78F73F|nr:pentatricopeptide repeat-containing protein At1g77170, mitochondrial-like [Phragmites australis]